MVMLLQQTERCTTLLRVNALATLMEKSNMLKAKSIDPFLRTLHDEDAFPRQGKLIRHLLSRDFKIDFVMKHLPTQS